MDFLTAQIVDPFFEFCEAFILNGQRLVDFDDRRLQVSRCIGQPQNGGLQKLERLREVCEAFRQSEQRLVDLLRCHGPAPESVIGIIFSEFCRPTGCRARNLDRSLCRMQTPEEKQARIAAINAILESGLTSNSVDGESSTFNHATLRDERRRLQRELGIKKKRNRVFNFNMGGR